MKRKLLLNAAILPGLLATAAMGQVVNFHCDNNGSPAQPPIDPNYYNVLFAGQGAYSDPGNNIWNGFGAFSASVFQSTYVYSGNPGAGPDFPQPYGNPGNPYSAYLSGGGWVSCTGPSLFLFSTASKTATGNASSGGAFTPVTLSVTGYTGDTAATPLYVQNGTPEFLLSASAYANASHSNAVFVLHNVPAGAYGLYLYGANPNNNRGTTFLVSSGTPHNGISSTLNNPATAPGRTFVEGQNFVIYENVTPDNSGDITITGTPNSADGNGNSNLAGEADVNGFQLIFNPPPTAQNATLAQNVLAGTTASFSFTPVFASGAAYQWQVIKGSVTNVLSDGSGISGSASTNLVIAAASSANVGLYQCVIATATATNTSPEAPLTIVTSTGALTNGSPTNIVGSVLQIGDTITDINNSAPANYYGDVPMNAVPQDYNHSVTNVEDGNLMSYINVGGNGTSAGFSGPVGFSVTPEFGGTIATGLRFFTSSSHPEDDPADYSLMGSTDGGNTFTPIAGGLLSLPVQRNLAYGAINVTNQVCYEVDFSNTTAYTTYQLMFTNVVDDATASNGVVLAEVQILGTLPAAPPTIVEAPAGTNEQFTGTTFETSVGAGGPGPFTYQWSFNSTPISGATASSLTIANVQSTNSGTYTVNITAPYGATNASTVLVVVAPTHYEQVLMSFNPLAYWPMSETSGTTVFEYVNGYNGTYVNPSGVVLDQPGVPYSGFGANSLSADLQGGYGEVPLGPFDITGPVTIMAWVQFPFAPGGFCNILGHGDSSYRISANTAGQPGFNDGGNNSGDATSATSIVDGNWHFVAAAYYGGSGTSANGILYVDGVAVASNKIISVAGNTLPLDLGAAPDYNNRNVSAYLAHLAVFPVALSASQIVQIFSGAEGQPSVSLPESTVTVDQGGTATIPSSPTGPPPLRFQWYYSSAGASTLIPGATNQSLTLTNVQLPQANLGYFVVVANTFGSVTSSFVSLNILTGTPTITANVSPTNSVAPVGVPVSFSVAAIGTEPFSYQWYQDGSIMAGATNSSVTVTSVAGSNTYNVIVGNADGSTPSDNAVVFGNTNAPVAIDFGTNGGDWTLNTASGSVFSPTIASNVLTLTDGANGTDTSAFYNVPQYIGSFFASYVYQAAGNKGADGVTFCIEESTNGPAAVGGGGGELGYFGISNSAAFEMNIYTGDSGGIGVTFATNGMVPSQDAVLGNFYKTTPVDIAGGDPIQVQLFYGQSEMLITMVDMTSEATFSTNFTLPNLPGIIGSSTAYVGFTGATGGVNSIQTISNFVFSYSTTPTLSVSKGAAGAVNVTWPISVATQFTLQSSANLLGPWSNVSATPVVANGKNEVTLPTGGSATFFRLVLQ